MKCAFMMRCWIVALLIVASVSRINAETWACETGDALGSLVILVGGPQEQDAIRLAITYPNETKKTMMAMVKKPEFRLMIKEGRAQLVFKSKDSAEFGQAVDKAALVSLTKDPKGTFSGYLSDEGRVYALQQCLVKGE